MAEGQTTVRLVDSSGADRIDGTLYTTIPISSGSLPTVSPSSGVAFQTVATRATTLYVTFTTSGTNAIASAIVALSPDNSTFSTVHTVSVAAAINTSGVLKIPDTLVVPAGWYVKLTLSNMTIDNATYA